MPPRVTLTVYNNNGTEVLGSGSLRDYSDTGEFNAYITDTGINADASINIYTYTGPGKWLGVSKSPNTTTAEYGPNTILQTTTAIKVYAVIKNTVNIDLSTLSGYQALANGTYSLRVKAKATGYMDSDMSVSVSWQKKEFTEVVPTLTHPFATNIETFASNAPFCSISNMDTSKIYTIVYKSNLLDDRPLLDTLVYRSNFNSWESDSTNGIFIHQQSSDVVELYIGTISGYTTNLNYVAVLCGNKVATIDDFTNIQYYQVLPSYTCIIEGTLITLADHTKKPIEDITYDDDLLVWNFYEGKFDSAKPVWITKPRLAHEYNLCKFSNGIEVGFVGNGGNEGYHRIYNDEAKAFTHTGVTETPIGTHTFAENGFFPELISQEVIKTPIRYYNIGTKEHINLFSNGILTSSRISNKYTIENMKYIGDRLINEKDEQEYIKHKLELC